MINIILIFLWTILCLVNNGLSMPSRVSNRSTIKANQLHLSESLSLNYCDEPICYKNDDEYGQDLGCFDPWPLTVYGSIDLYSVCPQDPSFIGTTFNIYHSSKPEQMIHSLDSINSSNKIVFFIPGYKNVYNDSRFIALKDELLSVVNVVILVDFANGADPGIVSRVTDFYNFHQAAANTQIVGRQIAVLLKNLKLKRGIDYDNVHLICFSLGTQVAHFMGSYALTRFGFQVGRITSLDPPGILIFAPGKRLNPSDAAFVDVIHTTSFKAPWDFNKAGSGKVGSSLQLGHVDFYPNGGGVNDLDQPGCLGIDWCSHAFSIALMRASINKCFFQAVQCSSIYANGQCKRELKDSRLGYWSNKYPGRGRYYLNTSHNPLINC